MTFLRDIVADLREKRLWPFAALLLVALVAVPVVLARGGNPPAAAPMAAPFPPPAIPPIMAPRAAPPPIFPALFLVWDSPLITVGCTEMDKAPLPELTVVRMRSNSPGSLSRPERCTSLTRPLTSAPRG